MPERDAPRREAISDSGTMRDPLKRGREAAARAKSNEALMKQVRESREAHRRGERGISGRTLHAEVEKRRERE